MSSDELAPLSVRRERERLARKRIREVTWANVASSFEEHKGTVQLCDGIYFGHLLLLAFIGLSCCCKYSICLRVGRGF